MKFEKKVLIAAMLSALAMNGVAFASDDDDSSYTKKVTIVQTGDFHGHLTPRPNLRSTKTTPGQMVGGLARIKTKIKQIEERNGSRNTLVMHTGDTLQGGGEAMYTRGQAMVDVVDMLGVDAYAPGNWDFVYGPERFKQFFANADGSAKRWGGLVSNLYVTSADATAPKRPSAITADATESLTTQDENVSSKEYDDFANWYVANGVRVLKPYRVQTVNGVKIGIVGCTTSRGPQVVGNWVTEGIEFTDCSREVPMFAKMARDEGAEVVVLISEIEIGRNIRIMKDNITSIDQHVDLILNSDMHEESLKPIEITNGAGKKTWIVEAGMDGTLINEITISVNNGVVSLAHKPHQIDDTISQDWDIAKKVAQVSYPYNRGFNKTIPCTSSSPYWNPFSQTATTCLQGPLHEVVGKTEIDLQRMNYSHEDMAAAIEGSSHDLLADAIRWWAGSDLATVRGFRYGQSIAGGTPENPGAITRNDLYHIVPVGPRVAKVSRISANQLRNQIDNSSLAVFSNDPNNSRIPLPRYNGGAPSEGLPETGLAGSPMGWGGGWLFAYSGDGFHMNFAPYFTTAAQTVKTGAPGSLGSGLYLDIDPITSRPYNIQVATPPADTSRARGLSVKVLCKQLPPTEVTSTACSLADTTTRYTTVITEETTGVYKPSWKALYATGTTYTPYLLNADGWRYLNGTPNQPGTTSTVNQHFKAGLFTVAGYWFERSPNSINNCNNCYPTGSVDGDVMGNMSINDGNGNKLINPNVAYLLPVNANADGTAALDVNGSPLVMQDATKADGLARDSGNKPIAVGNAIDLTAIVEKYLNHIGGTVNATNLKLNRISLVDNAGTTPIHLPDYSQSTLGMPLMQPLCGTIGLTTTMECLQ